MQVGIVEWFDQDKGFGSIITINKEKLFVHFTGIEDKGHRNLRQGDKVKFVIVEGMNGPQAIKVSKL